MDGIVTRVLIGGDWRVAARGETIPVVNPSDGQRVGAVARGAAEDIDRAVAAARTAYDGAWGRLSALERGRLLLKLAQAVAERHEELAQIEALDTGKPIRQARADITALARYFEYYGGAADKLHGETLPYLDGYTVMTLREPYGVTAHIIPWNYPAQIFGRSVGAALAVGNACVVKPALQAGQVFINNYGAGGGVELPFGGYKRSGHGREKGFEALYQFSQLKTVALCHG